MRADLVQNVNELPTKMTVHWRKNISGHRGVGNILFLIAVAGMKQSA